MRRGAKPAKRVLRTGRATARTSRAGGPSTRDELNKRLAEALDQQAATSEILRLISASPADVQPVFDAIAAHALRLCEARFSAVYRFDGQLIHLVAHSNFNADTLALLRRTFPRRPQEISHIGRAVRERAAVNLADVAGTGDAPPGSHRQVARLAGYRGFLAIPMIRGEQVVGCIALGREAAEPFPEEQVRLIRTFADQAVIAIENVRLVNETREALQQQTASAEILRVISSWPSSVQPVFEAIVRSGVALFDGAAVAVVLPEGGQVRLAAIGEADLVRAARWRERFPFPLTHDYMHAVAILDRRLVDVPDVLKSDVAETGRQNFLASGYRAVTIIPMRRDHTAIGAISVVRPSPGPLSEAQLALLETFADQAVIAIENVRLFREIEQKSRELEAASRHKSEFLANMSHELRTPLNAIIGFSEVLTERMFGELNAKQEEYLKDIHASGEHLLSLINDILDLSKIEAGRMELDVGELDLAHAIGNAVTLVRERAGRRGIALHQAVDPELGRIRGDERKIKQVLLNLLSNALKFTPAGGRVDVQATVVDEMVEVSVTDTGIGIAPEDQAAVFEEFRQVGTADQKVEGTGLGLALARKFIELHDGRIWVQSQVGHGSTFAFTLPRRREP